MKHLILITLTLFSLNSLAENNTASASYGKDCRRILREASEVNPAELSPIVQLAIRSCNEMPNREAVLATLEKAKTAQPNTRFELLRRLSARFVVYCESKIFGFEIEDIRDNGKSPFGLFYSNYFAQLKFNEVADQIGINRFNYIELRKTTETEQNPEPDTRKVYMRLARILYEQQRTQ